MFCCGSRAKQMAWDKQGGGAGFGGVEVALSGLSLSRDPRERGRRCEAMPEEGAIVWCLPNTCGMFLAVELLFKQIITRHRTEEKGSCSS